MSMAINCFAFFSVLGLNLTFCNQDVCFAVNVSVVDVGVDNTIHFIISPPSDVQVYNTTITCVDNCNRKCINQILKCSSGVIW